jgi:hypothetical protein
MDDPFAIRRSSGDNANVVTPNHNNADTGTSCICAFIRPLSGKRKTAVRFAEIPAHVSPAPGVYSVRMMLAVEWASVGVDGEHAQQSCRESGWLEHSVHPTIWIYRSEKIVFQNPDRDLWFRKSEVRIPRRCCFSLGDPIWVRSADLE